MVEDDFLEFRRRIRRGLIWQGRMDRRSYVKVYALLAFGGGTATALLWAVAPIAGGVLVLGLMFAFGAVCALRLHDFGVSAWWQIVANGPVVVLFLIGVFVPAPEPSQGLISPDRLWMLGVWFAMACAFWLGLAVIPGQAGDNLYGEKPRPLKLDRPAAHRRS